MLDVVKWIDEYPLQLTAAEKAVAKQALVDAYFMGFDDGKNGKQGDVFVDESIVPSWIQTEGL